MKNFSRYLFLLIVTLCLVVSDVTATNIIDLEQAMQNEAPSTDLKKVEAELVNAKNGTLWIRTPDGKKREVPLDSLSKPAQKYIENLATTRTIDDPAELGKINVQILGLGVNKIPLQTKSSLSSNQPQELKMTTLKLLISSPKQSIIGLDKKASRIFQFTDNLGTDLRKSIPLLELNLPKSSILHLDLDLDTLDGIQNTVQVRSFGTPAPGATKIRFKANLVLRCAGKKKTFEKKNLSPDTKIKILIGKTEVTLSCTNETPAICCSAQENSESLPATGRIQLISKEPLNFIQSIECFGPDGKRIEEETNFSFTSSNSPTLLDANHMKGCILKEKLDSFSIKFVYREKGEQISLPVDIETGVGF